MQSIQDITQASSWPAAKAARDQVRALINSNASKDDIERAKARYKALAVKCHREVGNLL